MLHVIWCNITLTKTYSYGQPGVECTVSHDEKVAVQKLLFLINEVQYCDFFLIQAVPKKATL